MAGRPRPSTISTKQQRIAKIASEMPQTALTSLSHHMDLDWLREAHRRTRRDGAPGVDGQTALDFEGDLEGNLQSLLDRAKFGRYRAPAVRRAHIPKGAGNKTRPIGIPTYEDKVLQRAVVMLLEPVYEHDFLDVSYGFRPGRSAHQALESVWKQTMDLGGGWLIDLDIQSFFDTVDRRQLQAFVRERVRDGVVLRLIGKWLKAGVLESGRVHHPDVGTPQGGVISPLLANIYLHHVLDKWYEEVVKPRLRGRTFLVRYADDAVLGFEHEEDARRVMAVLPKRFGKYGLTLHPEKTRLVDFRRPPPRKGQVKTGTFDLLGFTHFWGMSRKGRRVVKRKTASSRFSRALGAITAWCKARRHWPLRHQHRMLIAKLRGHYAYYGITGNAERLTAFRHEVLKIWRKWLNRRSQRCRMTAERFYGSVLKRYPVPWAVVVHSTYRRAANP